MRRLLCLSSWERLPQIALLHFQMCKCSVKQFRRSFHSIMGDRLRRSCHAARGYGPGAESTRFRERIQAKFNTESTTEIRAQFFDEIRETFRRSRRAANALLDQCTVNCIRLRNVTRRSIITRLPAAETSNNGGRCRAPNCRPMHHRSELYHRSELC